ncbi:MAG TPA: NUDIX domain-containing protein [Verrucomicrobiae bacterium]|nr:NUDIX domain-containing protein [Verrucomicrobiae bacterium]
MAVGQFCLAIVGQAGLDWLGNCFLEGVLNEPLTHKAGVALLRKGSQGDEVLLVQQANGRWSLPKGKRKPGESIKETGLRECREETGYEPPALDFVGWGINSRKRVRFYLWKSDAHPGSSERANSLRPRRREIRQMVWVALDCARQILKPWQGNLLAKIQE